VESSELLEGKARCLCGGLLTGGPVYIFHKVHRKLAFGGLAALGGLATFCERNENRFLSFFPASFRLKGSLSRSRTTHRVPWRSLNSEANTTEHPQ